MARIEPIPFEDLPAESRAMMEAGTATGMYTTTVPLQIVAYSTAALTAMHRQYDATFRKGVLEPAWSNCCDCTANAVVSRPALKVFDWMSLRRACR